MDSVSASQERSYDCAQLPRGTGQKYDHWFDQMGISASFSWSPTWNLCALDRPYALLPDLLRSFVNQLFKACCGRPAEFLVGCWDLRAGFPLQLVGNNGVDANYNVTGVVAASDFFKSLPSQRIPPMKCLGARVQ